MRLTQSEIQELNQCHAPPASDDVKNSKPIGPRPKTEHSDSDALIQLQSNTATILQIVQLQAAQIKDLQQAFQFLSTQVKTLVDALADEADPDAPLTTYMDGTPIR